MGAIKGKLHRPHFRFNEGNLLAAIGADNGSVWFFCVLGHVGFVAYPVC